ncbi:MAG: radical SAM protein, partial [Deltaproteobacteria bacterium]|nr:radical SAM protein [Deltaproteobacteria bacterium]
RQRPVSHVAEEIEWHIQAFRAKEILFFDETFTIGQKRVIELCHAIRDLGVKVGFNIRARADTITYEMAVALKEAGCTSVNMGIESGTDRILKVMNKGVTSEQMAKGIEMCRKAGLTSRGYFMLGYKGETREEIEETIRFAVESGLDFASFTVTQLNPATVDYETELFNGETEDYWRDYTLMKDVPATPPRPRNPQYSEDELQDFLRSAYRRFYLRPAQIGRYATNRRILQWTADTLLAPGNAMRIFSELMRPAYLSTGGSNIRQVAEGVG